LQFEVFEVSLKYLFLSLCYYANLCCEEIEVQSEVIIFLFLYWV
jgi:hypothetical protein